MALLVDGNIVNAYLANLIAEGFSTAHSITIYSGVQPTAQQILDNWSTYLGTNPNCLLHYSTGKWTKQPMGKLINLTPGFPTAVNALNTGTATWAILWSVSLTKAQLDSATIVYPAFMVVNVGGINSDSILTLQNTSITMGASVSIYDGSFSGKVL